MEKKLVDLIGNSQKLWRKKSRNWEKLGHFRFLAIISYVWQIFHDHQATIFCKQYPSQLRCWHSNPWKTQQRPRRSFKFNEYYNYIFVKFSRIACHIESNNYECTFKLQLLIFGIAWKTEKTEKMNLYWLPFINNVLIQFCICETFD